MLREVAVVGHRVEGWRVIYGELRMRPLAVQTFLVAIDPRAVSFIQVGTSSPRDMSNMVFQLNLPSYEMLRRWGNFVKSTLFVKASRPP